MKILVSTTAMIAASPALAHPGHLAEAAGHDHWVAGIAIGLAALVGIWAALKGRSKSEPASEAEEAGETGADEELQDA